MRAAIYTRISQDKTGQALGVERQQGLCEKLAEDRGWTVTQVFSDNDISAYSGKRRPGYEALCQAIEDGAIDAVVAYHPDRLHRQTKELEPFIDLVEKAGTQIATVAGGELDLTTPSGRAIAKTIGAWAQYESDRKRDRIRAQSDQSAANGWWQGGARPYGYEPDEAPCTCEKDHGMHPSLRIVEDEALIIKELAERVINGDSLRSIATDLNERGIPTSRGAKWRTPSIKATLTNGSVVGLRTHRGEIVGEGNWTGILSRSTWEQVKAVLATRGKGKRGRPSNHLLTGLLKCHKCGGTLWARKYKDTARYVCVKAAHNDHCGGTSINADPLEELITETVVTALRSYAPSVEMPVDTRTTTDEMEEIEERMERLSTIHFVEGKLTEREYLTARNGLEVKLTALRANLVSQPAVSQTFEVQDHEALWDSYTLDEKRKVIALGIEKIVVLPGNRWTQLTDRLRIHFQNGKVA